MALLAKMPPRKITCRATQTGAVFELRKSNQQLPLLDYNMAYFVDIKLYPVTLRCYINLLVFPLYFLSPWVVCAAVIQYLCVTTAQTTQRLFESQTRCKCSVGISVKQVSSQIQTR